MAVKKMKVKDLIKMDVDVDVYDNVCEELAIAFCGACELTDEGIAYNEVALNLDVELDEENGIAIVDVNDEFFPDLWEFKLKKAKEFFYSAAGWCSEEKYNRYFKTNADCAFKV